MRIGEMKTEHAVNDTDELLNRAKKLLDESKEIIDRIKALKAERAQLQPLSGSLRRRMIRCGKQNCKCRKGQLHGPYHYFVPSKCRGKWQYITEEDIKEVEQGVADWKKQQKIDAEIKDVSARLKAIRREVTELIPTTD
jgi:uncharacterized coiled-coil DUF342 family protein